MKTPLSPARPFIILLALAFAIQAPCLAQDNDRLRINAALQSSFALKHGQASEYLQGQALGTDSLWGLDAAYAPKTGLGLGLDASLEYQPISFLYVGAGLALKTHSVRDKFTIMYDPAVGGVARQSLEIVDDILYFSPRGMIGGRWKFISLSVGGELNFYVNARTRKILESENSSGQVSEEIETVKATTWDQPIYKNPNAVGGTENYTSATGMNHGLNANFVSPFVELKLNMPKVNNAPYLSFRYAFAGSPYRRSNNPNYSLVSGYNPGTLEELNLSSKIRYLTISAGWTF